MQVKDVMTTSVAAVPPHMAVEDVAAFLLERRISAAPVVDDDGRLLGIVSEGDLLRRPETGTERPRSWWLSLFASSTEAAADYIKTHGRRAIDVRTGDVVTVGEDTPLSEVAGLLERNRIKRLPVVRDGRLVGIISRADLLRALAAARPAPAPPSAADDRAIRDQLMAHLRKVGLPHLHLVNVVVSDGVVHLWGLVDSEVEGKALRIAAEEVPGVRAVESHLATRRASLPHI
jgi:CBS domain-containing protein